MSRTLNVMILTAALALGSAACGGDAQAPPAGPTTAAAPAGTQGATILGSVSAGTPLAAMAAQVVGTSISSPVGAGGDFTLSGVPEGSVQLRFVGSGVDASVSLNPVKAGDVVSLLVGVSGATATVEFDSRSSAGKVELEGRIESLSTTGTFVVSGRSVTTGPATAFRDESGAPKTFADLAVGLRVHVNGTLAADKITADLVTIQKEASAPTEPPGTDAASVEGVLSGLSGGGSTLTFTVGSTAVTTTKDTVVQRRGDVQDLTALANGQTVHVVGVRQPGGAIVAQKVQIKDDAPAGAFAIAGPMGGVKGMCPALTFVINGYSIATTTSTSFVPTGSCTGLKSGTKVEVAGTRQANGSVLATTVTKK